MMLLYEIETTGNVSEMHFTTLVENAIDWWISYCLTPRTTSAVCKTNDTCKEVQVKFTLRKKKKTSFIEQISMYLWSNMPIKCPLSNKGKQLFS